MVHKVKTKQLYTGELEVDGPAIFDGSVTMNGTVTQTGSSVRTGRDLWVPAFNGKPGATATVGWAVTGVDDGIARLAASATADTLVIPITGLHIGDTLQGVSLIGQVESAGANATMVMSVRKGIAAVADFTDAEIGTANMGTITADTLLSSAGTPVAVATLAEVLAEGEYLYALLTATTAALTDIAVSGLIVNYDAA